MTGGRFDGNVAFVIGAASVHAAIAAVVEEHGRLDGGRSA